MKGHNTPLILSGGSSLISHRIEGTHLWFLPLTLLLRYVAVYRSSLYGCCIVVCIEVVGETWCV